MTPISYKTTTLIIYSFKKALAKYSIAAYLSEKKFNSLFSISSYFETDDVCKQTIIESRFGKTEQGFQVWLYLLLNFKKNQMIAGYIISEIIKI